MVLVDVALSFCGCWVFFYVGVVLVYNFVLCLFFVSWFYEIRLNVELILELRGLVCMS